jgi:hypothetical protein
MKVVDCADCTEYLWMIVEGLKGRVICWLKKTWHLCGLSHLLYILQVRHPNVFCAFLHDY